MNSAQRPNTIVFFGPTTVISLDIITVYNKGSNVRTIAEAYSEINAQSYLSNDGEESEVGDVHCDALF